MGLRFAVDTGGTFTDLMVADEDNVLSMHKASTTPSDPIAGVIDSLKVASEAAGQSLADFLGRGDVLVHGTTHAINAIVTGSTASTAFLTTEGHPDTLVFREGGRIEPFNFTVPYMEPYVPKALTFEVPERIMASGSIKKPLDEAAVVAILDGLKERNVEAIAVCFLWSVVNPVHELAVGALIEKHCPGIPYTLSHRINPSIREYRRASSTCIDASLKPLMGAYMRGLEQRLRDAGFNGRVLVVTSQGGVMDAGQVAEAPVHLINSGPSMAPLAAKIYGGAERDETLIVGDTGGTTFDVSLVRRGRVPRSREAWLGQPFRSHMTGMPSVDVKSIGAGGGSIAWVDAGGLLHVGPKSAGAVPGPVCYGRGGTRPTLTDAALVLGFIDEAFFLGGRMALDKAGAIEAIRSQVAEPLGKSVEAAAVDIVGLATEHMVQAIMDITVNQGIDQTQATFVAGGGAAGLNCVAIAKRLGCRRVLVTEAGAALSASGALISDLTAHYQAMFHTRSDSFDLEGVNGVLADLMRACQTFADGPGSGAGLVEVDWATEARYVDQAWEIEVPLRTDRFTGKDEVAALVSDFHQMHKDIFAVSDPAAEIETVGWNAEVRCRLGSGVPGRLARDEHPVRLPSRRVHFLDGDWVETDVWRFESILEGQEVTGPAIVESDFTSIVIDPKAVARRDARGNLVISI
ncbi:hydantoinase/oxoprolinase family protein [Mesorhizobium sp. BAC0120]|uniref:hydantoinase/oxoprolinase family protein n=1 Tax=Mesorhizobium sp. BAC0120 TaxID=3090670 RepID=UPI00298CF922|nr:hydantoinase/oxoprolinase family protein [Mesorhizobium sp. BAC0120]MDW6023526.1 hydantoinase/oxoprolinase family protein [Mesorhizobium sp. BAC0120]